MSVRMKSQIPVGCVQWVQDENHQISQFGIQEAEDFAFSARNEFEWLNEHMAEIFSKSQVNVTEIFKTPGKLRGKTPRTARKYNPLEIRQPLTDLFSTNLPLQNSSSNVNKSPNEVKRFEVAKDSKPVTQRNTSKPNTDSGYHGMSDDEMDIDQVARIAPAALSPPTTQEMQEGLVSLKPPSAAIETAKNLEEQRTTEGSFHSALEEVTKKEIHKEALEQPEDVDMEADLDNPTVPTSTSNPPSPPAPAGIAAVSEDAMDLAVMENEFALEEHPSVDASRSSWAGSSPVKAFVRKSSLTFAALPAREPLTTKKSIGAQVSGTNHLEQTRTTLNRTSFLGRFTGGKSVGSLRQPEIATAGVENEMDDDKAEKPALAWEESDGDTKSTRLHNKSSTQRLHDKINMLGKSQPARPTKSIPAAAVLTQPTYPDLTALDSDLATLTHTPAEARVSGKNSNDDDDDDDDWIKPPQTQPPEQQRPQLSKSISADVMEDIRGKRNIGDQQFGISNHDRDVKEPSPLGKNVILGPQRNDRAHSHSTLTCPSKSPLKPQAQDLSETMSTSNAVLESAADHGVVPKISTTPIGTPTSKRCVDGPLSASKSKLQSIMKTARGLFTSSAGVSAQAKMETMSLHSTPKRNQVQVPLEDENRNAEPIQSLKGDNLPNTQPIQEATFKQCSNTSAKVEEVRKTRSSTEKETRQKEKEAKEREQTESKTEQLEEKEGSGATAQNRALRSTNPANITSQAEVAEKKFTNNTKKPKSTRQSPRRVQNQKEPINVESDEGDNGLNPHLAAAPSIPAPRSSRIRGPGGLRGPIGLGKEAASKVKPQPVAIKVGTLSQRFPLTNANLSSTLQESLPPHPPPPYQSAPAKKPSNVSSHTSTSNASFKSSASFSAPKSRALLAAERKKEQYEKEVQRKLEQKREVERKRAAQQEEMRRQEQAQRQEIERQRERERALAAEDSRKITQKQAIEKKRLEAVKKEQQRQGVQHEKSQPLTSSNRHDLGPTRPPSRLFGAQDHNRPNNQHPVNPAKPMKRVFDPDHDDVPLRPAHAQGAPPYQQSDAKRRRTDDEEDIQEVIIRPTMAPPIRKSNIRKDGPKQSIYTSGYTSTQVSSNLYHHSSMVKQSVLNQAYQQHQHPNHVSRAGMPGEMTKYAHGKVPFAEVPNPPPKSPQRARQAAPTPAKSSPQWINGENIELAEIPTDDEETDSDDDKAKDAMVADWAKSPFLGDQLETQERYADPDEIFGPVRSPHMEEMFKGREHRYRNRTSSANWAGSDRLTEEEIRSDRAAREKLRRQGGWSFEL